MKFEQTLVKHGVVAAFLVLGVPPSLARAPEDRLVILLRCLQDTKRLSWC